MAISFGSNKLIQLACDYRFSRRFLIFFPKQRPGMDSLLAILPPVVLDAYRSFILTPQLVRAQDFVSYSPVTVKTIFRVFLFQKIQPGNPMFTSLLCFYLSYPEFLGIGRRRESDSKINCFVLLFFFKPIK